MDKTFLKIEAAIKRYATWRRLSFLGTEISSVHPAVTHCYFLLIGNTPATRHAQLGFHGLDNQLKGLWKYVLLVPEDFEGNYRVVHRFASIWRLTTKSYTPYFTHNFVAKCPRRAKGAKRLQIYSLLCAGQNALLKQKSDPLFRRRTWMCGDDLLTKTFKVKSQINFLL